MRLLFPRQRAGYRRLERFSFLFALLCSIAGAQTSGWSATDVGAVGAAGSSSEAEGVVTLHGSGADIGGTEDEFHYRYVSWSGDGVFLARITSLSSVDNWAKAGIMVRSDLSAGSAHFFAGVNPARIAARTVRTAASATASLGSDLRDLYRFMPMWVKLIRDGNSFAMHFSGDGVQWFTLGDVVEVPMPPNVLVGLAVTSKADGQLARATIDTVRFGPIVPQGFRVVTRSPSRVELQWFDPALRESGYEIERSSDGSQFARVATTAAFSGAAPARVRYTDETASPSTQYWYRVRALWSHGPSSYSDAVSATTPPVPPAGWIAQDIGDTLGGGSVVESGGQLRVTGSGVGIGAITTENSYWSVRGIQYFTERGGADEFFFAAKPWNGDGELVARITALDGAAHAQAAAMVRGGLEANAAQVSGVLRGDGSSGVLVRTREVGLGNVLYRTDGTYSAAGANSPPFWIKLVRAGGGVMTYLSADGAVWVEGSWTKPALGSEIYFGLGVAGGAGGAVASATFDHVSVGPVITSIAPATPANVKVRATGFDSMILEWTHVSTSIDRVEVERSTDGLAFASVGSGSSTFSDGGLVAGTTYYYRVRAVRGTFASEYSPALSATTPAVPPPPSEFTAVALSPTLVDLTWAPAAGVYRYNVERSSDNATFAAVGHGQGGLRDTTVQPGTTYYYRLITTTAGGNSAPSASRAVTTPELTPTGAAPLGTQPLSRALPMGGSVTLLAPPASGSATYQWFHDGVAHSHVSGPEYSVFGHSTGTGLYSVIVTDGGAAVMSSPAVVALLTSEKTTDLGTEVGADIRHPNGNIYDQVLVNGSFGTGVGSGPTVTADPGQVTRVSFLDHSHDIVQVEFSGAGSLTVELEGAMPRQQAVNYNQPDVLYTLGQARLLIAGADETTNVSVFTVGRVTAVNQALFRDDVGYDGRADLAYIAILSRNGKFGGVRAGNAHLWAAYGYSGLYAPGVTFTGPIVIGDIGALQTATPFLAIGGAMVTPRIAGGELRQENGRAIEVDTPVRLEFAAGVDSHGRPLSAKTNQARFERNGEDVTAEMAGPP